MNTPESDLERLARKQKENRKKASSGPNGPQPQLVLPPPTAPMQVARRFVEARCMHDGKPDELTLRFWCGCWWVWQTTHWIEAEPRTVRAMLYAFTEHAVYLNDIGERKQW